MSQALTLSSPAKLGLLGALYFSQGLPFGFFTQALPVLLRKQGYTLSQIGLASLLAVPWALKFLWAPLVDRYYFPEMGRRRSWILPLQLAAVLTLFALAAFDAMHHRAFLFSAVFILNFIAATQDIATDGLAVDALSFAERGLANGLQVAGYRVGMIAGGGALLIFFDQLGARWTFLAMAGLTALASLPILLTRERSEIPTSRKRASGPPSSPLAQFFRRPGVGRILALVVIYKLGDAFATGMLRPFLADRGLDLADIGWLLGTVGFVAGLLGALVGGSLVSWLGRKRALLVFGAAAALSIVGYAYLATASFSQPQLYVVCSFEHFAGGMATAALFTSMMDWCVGDNSATEYTVQASAVVIATGVATIFSGFSAQALGYAGHFLLGALLALLAVGAVAWLFPTPTSVQVEPSPQPGIAREPI